MGLTVIIPTLNEEVDLPRTLKSVGFADEVLVVDTGSTDKTLEIAKSFGARVANHPFVNFTELRNFADKEAKHDWILSIDADVVVPPLAAEEIKRVTQGAPKAFKIGRINIIFGKKILHSDWGPRDDNHIRLYHRSLGSWRGDVHETFTPKDQTQVSQLESVLLHYNYATVEEFVTKINSYSNLEVERRLKNGKRFGWPLLPLEPLLDFGKRFVYKLGFLDGLHGLFLAYLQAIYYLTVQIKLYTKAKRT